MSIPPSSGPPTRKTVREVVDALDTDLASVSRGVAAGTYAMWLGSGISRDSVPSVSKLLTRVLAYLQERIATADPDCPFRKALGQIFSLGMVPNVLREAVDFAKPVDDWVGLDEILRTLAIHYSRVMEVPVDGTADEDFLLWAAADVRALYADTKLVPDAEHLCLAVLALEGALNTAATANWDGLIEAAMDLLAGPGNGIIDVRVHDEDFRGPPVRCELIKFHGCAVKAALNPEKYRAMLIVRDTQVTGWIQSPEHKLTVQRLTSIVAERPTLMIGLSAQDANIQEIFSRAKKLLAWPWPSDPTAMVFCEEEVGFDQTKLLKLMYRDEYADHQAEILASCRIGSFAKPFLVGLVLQTLMMKMRQFISANAAPLLNVADADELILSLGTLRDKAADTVGVDHREFVLRLIGAASFAMTTFRTGEPESNPSTRYEPFSVQPVHLTLTGPASAVFELRCFSIALALIASGLRSGAWSVALGDPARPKEGVLSLSGPKGSTKVFVVRDSLLLAKLESSGYFKSSDANVLAVIGTDLPTPSQRSPRVGYGRTGIAVGREVSIEAMIRDAPPGGLVEHFLRQVAA